MKKLRELTGCKACERNKELAKKFPFKGEKTNAYDETVMARETLVDYFKRKKPIRDSINSKWKEENFLNIHESEEKKESLIQQLGRAAVYLEKKFMKGEIATNRTHSTAMMIDYSIEEFSDDFTFVVKREKEIELIKIFCGKPKLKRKGRTPNTSPIKNSMFLGDLMIAKQLASDEGLEYATNTVIYLKNENDKDGICEFDEETQEVSIAEKTDDMSNLNAFINSLQYCRSDCDYCDYNQICSFLEVGKISKKEKEGFIFNPDVVALSEEQIKVVECNQGIARVNAGAGVGKTFTLCFKVMYLIQMGVEPKDIVITTYTNAGVDEIRDRLSVMAKGFEIEDIDQVNVLTLNSIGALLLSKYYKELGYTSEPVVVDKRDMIDIVVNLLNKYKFKCLDYKVFKGSFKGNFGVIPKVLEEIKKVTTSNVFSLEDMEEYMQENGSIFTEEAELFYDFFNEYKKALKESNLIEFIDQEKALTEIAGVNPKILSTEPILNPCILIVDEFQDSNEENIELVKMIASSSRNILTMVIGDDNQAIFGFKGTSPEYIIDFPKIMGTEVQDFYINTNRRSTSQIVNLANLFIGQNQNRVNKSMTSDKYGEMPSLYSFEESKDEIKYIVNSIKKDLANGMKMSDICVIDRKKSGLNKIISELSQYDIPSQSEITNEYLQNSRVRAIVSFCRWLRNLDCLNLLIPYFNIKVSGIENASSEEIENFAEAFKISFYTAEKEKQIEMLKNIFKSIEKEEDLVYSSFINAELAKNTDADKVIDRIIKLEEYDSDEGVKIIQESDAVTFITAHSSKGREWKKVYVSLSNFQNKMVMSKEEWEELRRLVFVAITRAKEDLVITSVKNLGTKSNRYTNKLLNELKSFIPETLNKTA